MISPCSRRRGHAEGQANRGSCGLPVIIRPGFSLIELLIVLAVLTIAAGFVLPALNGPLERSRLRSGAVRVQNAWGKARSFAIREGRSMTFRCRPGGRSWKIERSRQTTDIEIPSVNSENQEGGSTEDESTSSRLKTDGGDGLLMREGRLPDGVSFVNFEFIGLPYSNQHQVSDRSLSSAMVSETEPDWSMPLTFRADGRCQDACLRISGADDFAILVKIRGLTSGASFTAPFRETQTSTDLGRQQ
ncbi:MAG: prepilin-type N-terminal cleavage/methylation domain-containing protein [Fuerstiella sp.]|nr:prepilin-type N-terminal cleavage/methylation domain-containing protein [Fuerstiella sp.]